jgi:hypothetical protein
MIRAPYFAAVGLLFVVDLAGSARLARRRRFRSRFLACDRLRVFSRALILGAMHVLLWNVILHPTLLRADVPASKKNR